MRTAGSGPALVIVFVVGVLFATGVSLLLERSLTRILLGVILLGNGANLLILLGGRSGGAPVVGTGPVGAMSDPLPQALVLTSIVITLGLTALLLAIAYQSWMVTGDEEVQDDLEDRKIVELADRNELPAGDVDDHAEGREQVDPASALRRLRRGDGG